MAKYLNTYTCGIRSRSGRLVEAGAAVELDADGVADFGVFVGRVLVEQETPKPAPRPAKKAAKRKAAAAPAPVEGGGSDD